MQLTRVHVRRILIVKGIIAVGLTAAYLVPKPLDIAVASCANFLWLFWEEHHEANPKG